MKAAPAPNFGGDPTLPTRFTNLQVVNSSGQAVLTNPDPGTVGNTAYYLPGLRGPSLMGFNFEVDNAVHCGLPIAGGAGRCPAYPE